MDNIDVITRQAPNGQCTSKRRDTCIGTFKHTVHGDPIHFLTSFLDIRYTRGEVFVISGFPLGLVELGIFSMLCVLVCEPLRYPAAPEVEVTGAICDIEDGHRVSRGDLFGDTEDSTIRSRNGTARFVTVTMRFAKSKHGGSRRC
jgi:hypothetical protein